MPRIVTYLTFSGNCREAMEFYQQCLGGTLELRRVGDSPMAEQLPEPMKDCILHASLTKKNMALMGTDMVQDVGLSRGNAVSILLDCKKKGQLKKYYNRLKRDGNPTHALERTDGGALFGGLTDKYGNHWLFYHKG